MFQTCRPEPIIRMMGVEDCSIAKSFLKIMGNKIPVTEENIRKSVDMVHPGSAMRFCRHWLEWEDAGLWNLTNKILYPKSRRSRYWDMLSETRHRIARAAIAAAITAYIEEMRKP